MGKFVLAAVFAALVLVPLVMAQDAPIEKNLEVYDQQAQETWGQGPYVDPLEVSSNGFLETSTDVPADITHDVDMVTSGFGMVDLILGGSTVVAVDSQLTDMTEVNTENGGDVSVKTYDRSDTSAKSSAEVTGGSANDNALASDDLKSETKINSIGGGATKIEVYKIGSQKVSAESFAGADENANSNAEAVKSAEMTTEINAANDNIDVAVTENYDGQASAIAGAGSNGMNGGAPQSTDKVVSNVELGITENLEGNQIKVKNEITATEELFAGSGNTQGLLTETIQTNIVLTGDFASATVVDKEAAESTNAVEQFAGLTVDGTASKGDKALGSFEQTASAPVVGQTVEVISTGVQNSYYLADQSDPNAAAILYADSGNVRYSGFTEVSGDAHFMPTDPEKLADTIEKAEEKADKKEDKELAKEEKKNQ